MARASSATAQVATPYIRPCHSTEENALAYATDVH